MMKKQKSSWARFMGTPYSGTPTTGHEVRIWNPEQIDKLTLHQHPLLQDNVVWMAVQSLQEHNEALDN